MADLEEPQTMRALATGVWVALRHGYAPPAVRGWGGYYRSHEDVLDALQDELCTLIEEGEFDAVDADLARRRVRARLARARRTRCVCVSIDSHEASRAHSFSSSPEEVLLAREALARIDGTARPRDRRRMRDCFLFGEDLNEVAARERISPAGMRQWQTRFRRVNRRVGV